MRPLAFTGTPIAKVTPWKCLEAFGAKTALVGTPPLIKAGESLQACALKQAGLQKRDKSLVIVKWQNWKHCLILNLIHEWLLPVLSDRRYHPLLSAAVIVDGRSVCARPEVT